MQKITSRDNPKLKLARKVRDGRDENLVFAEGMRLARDLVRAGAKTRICFLSSRVLGSEQIAGIAADLESAGCECVEVPDSIFEQIADTGNSQGIAVLCDRPQSDQTAFGNRFSGSISLLLTEISNPSNLGAILRTAEAFNVRNVIVTQNSADVFSAKSIRGSMGAALRLNILTGADFNETAEWARSSGITMLAADIAGVKTPAECDWSRPSLIVFGSEAHGLKKEQLAACDELFSIPMSNDVESLNLGVAAGIILYEATRGK